MRDDYRPDTASTTDDQDQDLLKKAVQTEQEQEALIDSATFEAIKAQYESSLETYIEEKHEQVERIEERLENILVQQEALLTQYQAEHTRKTLLLPGKRAALEQNIAARQACIQRLHSRLERVQEIREEMTPHGPKIEQLAHRKLRIFEPELASSWDAVRTAERHRRLQQLMEKTQSAQAVRTLSRTLGITKERT